MSAEKRISLWIEFILKKKEEVSTTDTIWYVMFAFPGPSMRQSEGNAWHLPNTTPHLN